MCVCVCVCVCRGVIEARITIVNYTENKLPFYWHCMHLGGGAGWHYACTWGVGLVGTMHALRGWGWLALHALRGWGWLALCMHLGGGAGWHCMHFRGGAGSAMITGNRIHVYSCP